MDTRIVAIEVDSDDIAGGKQRNCFNCPVSRSIQRKFRCNVIVTPYKCKIGNTTVDLPPEATAFLIRFDYGIPALCEPFSFDLVVPQNLWLYSNVLGMERPAGRKAGKPISIGTCENAVSFLWHVEDKHPEIPLPTALASPEGLISILWQRGDNKFTANFRTTKRLDIYCLIEGVYERPVESFVSSYGLMEKLVQFYSRGDVE